MGESNMNAVDEIIPASDKDKIFFSHFHSLGDHVVKKYDADFTKTSAANMGYAAYNRYYITSLQHFDQYLKQLSSRETITLGLTQQISGISRTAEQIRNGKNGIYRGKEHLFYYNSLYPSCGDNEYSLYFFDIDFSEGMPTHFAMETPCEVRKSLIALIPPLEGVGMLIRPSSSGNIYNSVTGEKRSAYPSWHVYIVVANSNDETNKNLTELIKRRAWREDVNLAYIKEGDTSLLERYYTDLAVASPERIIIESAPILEAPLKKEDVPSTFYEGGILNLGAINYHNEQDYRETFAQQKKLLSKAVQQVSSKTMSNINTNINTPSVKSGKTISISLTVQEGVMEIYNYLQNTKKPDAKELMSKINDQIVSVLLTFLGYEIDASFKFKIRDEKTASASIRFDGLIKDFGGTFSGSIINFIMEFYQLSFLNSWNYLQLCFGKKQRLSAANRGALPNPSDFEKSLQLK